MKKLKFWVISLIIIVILGCLYIWAKNVKNETIENIDKDVAKIQEMEKDQQELKEMWEDNKKEINEQFIEQSILEPKMKELEQKPQQEEEKPQSNQPIIEQTSSDPEPEPETKTDRNKMIEIFKADALAKWGDDYQMVNYEVGEQTEAYDWIVIQTKYPEIMTRAKQKWGNDYGMVKYEYEEQVEAYESL